MPGTQSRMPLPTRPSRHRPRSTFANTAFGLILPVLCFALDHATGFHVYGAWTTTVRGFVGGELWLFAWATFHPPSSDFLRAGLGSSLAIGALFALSTGFCLLPSSVFGCFVLIGALGFVPFGTAFAFGFESFRSLKGVRRPWLAALGALAFPALLIVPAIAWRHHQRDIAAEALAVIDAGGGASRAQELLGKIPECDRRGLPGIDTVSAKEDLALWMDQDWAGCLLGFPLDP